MPTYNAVGVSMSLVVADLESTLTTTLEARQGATQQAAARRIDDAFEACEPLTETPVSIRPNGRKVMDYIGQNDDFPMLMVEAGDQTPRHWAHDLLRSSSRHSLQDGSVKAKGIPHDQRAFDASTALLQRFGSRSLRSKGAVDTKPLFGYEDIDGIDSVDSSKQERERSHPAKALRLKLEWSEKTFTCAALGVKAYDMKAEIFVNGVFAGLKYVPCRGYTTATENSWCLSGIRCHRQIEKPFVYLAIGNDDPASTSAGKRWSDIAEALQWRAYERGRNRYNEAPPTGEYLIALSNLSLPTSLAQNKIFGIIDVILTAGSGAKYGPESNYMTTLTRMGDEDYKVDENAKPAFSRFSRVGYLSHGDLSRNQNSLTLRQKTSIPSTLGIYPTIADSEPSSRADSYLELMETEQVQSQQASYNQNVPTSMVVKLKLANPLTALSPRKSSATSDLTLGGKSYIPQYGRPNAPQPDSNLSEEGRLLNSHTSARSEPPRVGKLPSLPSTPNFGPPMYAPPPGRDTGMSSPKRVRLSSTAPSPVRRSARNTGEAPAVRAAKSLSVRELRAQGDTPEKALKAFQIPQTCVGSVLSLAEGESFRQLGKERKGQFKEDSVVVGVRFLVV